jgi:hypothetical protein
VAGAFLQLTLRVPLATMLPFMRTSRSQPTSAPRSDSENHLARLVETMERIEQELHVLREAIDEVREEFVWAVRNDKLRFPPVPVPVTSMPINPLASDFAERVNRFTPEDLPPEESIPESHRAPIQHGNLFSWADDES